MKIAGRVIQNRNIQVNTPEHFEATYKGLQIVITTDHGFGDPEYPYLKRYSMDAYGIENGIYDVQTWKDLHSMEDAIRETLEGACL